VSDFIAAFVGFLQISSNRTLRKKSKTNLTIRQAKRLERFPPIQASLISFKPTVHLSAFFKDTEKDNKWVVAMKEEITTLEKRNTWTIVPLSNGRYVVGYKWVYKVKYKVDGSVKRYKARLVAKGCSQKEGIDFNATCSPVTKMVIVRSVLAVVSVKN